MSDDSPVPYPPAPYPTSGGGNATLALVLGIVGVVGGLGSCCCCLFFVLNLCSPFAWYLGSRELAAIRAGQSPASGESNAKTGMILGMVGSGLLVLFLIRIVFMFVLFGASAAMEGLKQGGVPLGR